MASDTGGVDQRRLTQTEKGHWLRGIGHITRPLVFLLGIGGWIILWYVWLARADISHRPPASLTLKEIIEPFVWFFLWLGPLLLLVARFINFEGGVIEWEAWGKVGVGLAAVAAMAAVWLITARGS
jgi:hypothetical protein